MALQNMGAVAGSIIAPVQSYAPGTRTVGPETIPPGISTVLFLIDLRSLGKLTGAITWAVEYSLDGGTSWLSAGGGGLDLAASGYTLDGTTLRNQEGGPVRMSGSMRAIPRTDVARQVRLKITNTETMTVGATVAVW